MRISCNSKQMDIPLIHRFLSEESQWAKGISLPVVEKAIKNSLCFAGYVGSNQMAFARVVSDYATFANLVDVFVLQDYRGKGYGKEILEAVLSHSELQGLRRFTLATADAHGLYQQYGFNELAKPQVFMEKYDPNVYTVSP
jgi:GNAT superfamily N-acetyltransferase